MAKPDTLMTYNLNYGEQFGSVIQYLGTLPLEQRPLIACMQEAPEPYINHFAGELGKIGYTSLRFASAIKKNGQVFGELTVVGLGAEITDSKEIDFGLSLKEKIYPGLKGRSGRRSALITTVRTPERVVQVANMHQPLIASDAERWKNILKVNLALDPDIPAIIAGDQNFSDFLRPFRKDWLLKQMDQIGFQDSGNKEHTFNWRGLSWLVDYIGSRGLEVKHPRVEKIKLSDHEPLFVAF